MVHHPQNVFFQKKARADRISEHRLIHGQSHLVLLEVGSRHDKQHGTLCHKDVVLLRKGRRRVIARLDAHNTFPPFSNAGRHVYLGRFRNQVQDLEEILRLQIFRQVAYHASFVLCSFTLRLLSFI